MKRLSVAVLALLMILGSVFMTSCNDPLEDKVAQMNEAYDELGMAFYNAVKNCSFNGVYDSDEYADQFSEWQAFIKQARADRKNYLDFDEAGLDNLISSWKEVTQKIDELAAKYPLPSGLDTEELSGEESNAK